MKKSVVFASKAGLVVVLVFIAVLGHFSETPTSQWLMQSFSNMALNITFALDCSLPVANALAAAILLLVFLLTFWLSKPCFSHLDSASD